MKIFFGKISQTFAEQHEKNFYAGGDRDSPWYNGLSIGDYVFPIFGGKIYKLWRVKEFGSTPSSNKILPNQAALFEVVKILDKPIHLATQFCMYRFFDLNLNLLNKSTKSTSSEQKGFYEITKLKNCPDVNSIDLSDSRKIIIAFADINYTYSNNDIRVTINNEKEEYSIDSIEVFKDGRFELYQSLWNLYDKKNKEKYSLSQLLKYAQKDKAPKKEKYLNAVITDLDEQGYFVVSQPIALYDNVLVGRKKYFSKKNKATDTKVGSTEEDIDESTDESKFEKYLPYVELLDFNPNIILYGPPGTGKTYTAQRIVEANEYNITKDPSVKFEDIKNEGRAEFVTFHQSYSYEEFVEGIRPVINMAEESESEVEGIKYEIKPGILRNIANNASLNILKENKGGKLLNELRKDSKIYKVSLGERSSDRKLYERFKKDNVIAIGWLDGMNLEGKEYGFIYDEIKKTRSDSTANPRNDASSTNLFVNQMEKGDIVFIYDGPFTIRDIGIIIGDYKHNSKGDLYNHTREVKWIREFGKKPLDISSYNSNVRLTLKTIYPLNRITFDDLVSIIGEEGLKKETVKSKKPFYIIIDEINRGNISKIFGELITLIEKDKRGSLKVTLPYSQKPFTIPANLYFIGTMNTADRSIAILDTALRRRFVFIELEPDSSVIQEVSASANPIIEGKINLSLLLDAMNKKIEKEYDRDHRIGHSYFLNATNMKSLRKVWYYQIIPLLLEYFYNDGEKVSKIIGEVFINKKTCSVNNGLSNTQFTEEIVKLCK